MATVPFFVPRCTNDQSGHSDSVCGQRRALEALASRLAHYTESQTAGPSEGLGGGLFSCTDL